MMKSSMRWPKSGFQPSVETAGTDMRLLEEITFGNSAIEWPGTAVGIIPCAFGGNRAWIIVPIDVLLASLVDRLRLKLRCNI